jgi:hypothetical protein
MFPPHQDFRRNVIFLENWGEPAISLHSHHVSLVQWTTCLLPVMRGSGSKSQGGTWNLDSPVSIVSLHWWPRPDSDHWLCCPSLGASLCSVPTMCKPAASSPFNGCFTGLRTSMCKPTWSTWSHSSSVTVSPSLQVLLQASQLTESAAGGGPVESLQSHFILAMSPWPVDYPFASRHEGPRFKAPGGYLCETGNLLWALSCYKTSFLFILNTHKTESFFNRNPACRLDKM